MSKLIPHDILQTYEPGLPSHFWSVVYRFAMRCHIRFHPAKFFYHFDKKEMKGKQVVLIADHSSRDNFYYVLGKYPFVDLNSVMGYSNFYDAHFLRIFTKIGVVPKSLYGPDFKAAKSIMNLLSQGASICLFPEGIQSTIGAMQPMNPATIQFLKQAGVPVVLCSSRGAYLAKPRAAKGYRKGKMEFHYSILFTPEELKEMDEEALYAKYLEAFYYNDFAWNEKEKNHYKSKDSLMKGFEKILFHCPVCGKDHELGFDGKSLVCSCGAHFDLDDTYALSSDHPLPFSRLDEWNDFQRDLVRKKVKDPAFSFSYEADLYELVTTKVVDNSRDCRKCGRGKVTINHDGLTFDGLREEMPYHKHIPLMDIPCAPFMSGYANEVFYSGGYLRLVPTEKPNRVAEITMIVEELHRQIDPKWDRVSADAFERSPAHEREG